MTENNTETREAEEAQPPETTSYELRCIRVFEMDFTEQQIAGLLQQTGAESPEEAIEQVFVERERNNVEPEQKLLGIDVKAENDD